MKIPATFALGLILGLDILAMSVSCGEARPPGSRLVPSSVVVDGQVCRDQIVSCFGTSQPTCPYPMQSIELKRGTGCSPNDICICRCPASPVPKIESP